MSFSHRTNSKPCQSIIAPDGYRGVIILSCVALGMLFFGRYYLAGLHLFLAGFVAFFFRNPKRVIPDMPQAVVSPADGKVVVIKPVQMEGIEEPYTQVSIFLSIFNVHINRSPLAGTVESVNYTPGKFKAAFEDKASSDNEHNTIVVQGDKYKVFVKQIAGLIARRIVCWIKPGDRLERGERLGLIRFGSRVDLFLPTDKAQIKVKLGDKVQGGASIIAMINKPDK
jgi:phosphatidylserine decarboxylase